MDRRGSPDRTEALAYGGARFAFLAVFIGDDVKMIGKGAQEFAGG